MQIFLGMAMGLGVSGRSIFDDGSPYVVADYVDADYFTP